MEHKQNTAPARKSYCVWADCNRRVYQDVEAASPEEAFRIAKAEPDAWEYCADHVSNGYLLSDKVMDLETEEFTQVAEATLPTVREASQHLYNAIQYYLDVPDSELPKDLVEAMDEMEAAWHKADGTLPEQEDGNAT